MKIVLLGSGNVATHLGRAFKMAGQSIVQVWSRQPQNAQELADSVGAAVALSLEEVVTDADLYILAVKDDAIRTVAEGLELDEQLIVHTSGSAGMDVLENISKKIGVFYPLQTFSKSKAVDFRQVPIAVEGNTPEVTQTIRAIADRLSEKVILLDSLQRRTLHAGAVFACNFTNHMYTLARHLLDGCDLPFDLLRPLIAETAAKIQHNDPATVQTGPAIRHDQQTMDAHLDLLQRDPALKELYRMLSQSIINYHSQA